MGEIDLMIDISGFNLGNLQVKLSSTHDETYAKGINKKIIDDYTLEMFGRRGWICKECNNFNYEIRKKCNKCHINKKMKKLCKTNNCFFEENKELQNGNNWLCNNCGNLNYSFRLICNRCKIKRGIQTFK